MEPINLKKEGLKVLLGIIFILLLIFFIRVFNLGFWGRYILLCGISLAFSIYGYIKSKKFSIWGLLKNWIILLGFLAFIYYYGGYLGFFGICFLIAGWKLWRRRKKFIELKHRIESMIWEKPLHEYREKGEKPPKVKMVWKK